MKEEGGGENSYIMKEGGGEREGKESQLSKTCIIKIIYIHHNHIPQLTVGY